MEFEDVIADRSALLVAQPSRVAAVEDIEEIPDWYFHRPIARRVVQVLLPTAVTPNQVTAMSAAAGVTAGVVLALGVTRPALRLVSAGLLLVSVVLDCVDGQLARARNTMSAGGTTLDTLADVVVALSVVGAAAYVLSQDHNHEFPLVGIFAAAALVGYAAQCFFFDVAKERYLASHGLRYASSKSVLADQQAKASATVEPRDVRGVLFNLFDRYWEIARTLTGTAQATASDEGMSCGRMKAWTFLGQGTHMTALYVATAASFFWPFALYGCLLLFSIAMNGLMMLLLLTESPNAR